RLQRRLGLTTVFITHDQEEALILSDRIAVMNRGRIEQVAPPRALYERPANAFVADFVGESNLMFGQVETAWEGYAKIQLEDGLTLTGSGDMPLDARVGALIRPELLRRVAAGTQSANTLCGEVIETVYVGTSHKYRMRMANGAEFLVRVR